MSEVRHYLWLRLTVLGTGAAIVLSMLVASVQLWPIVQRVIAPTRLACGCAVLSVTTPGWLTGTSMLVITATVLLLGWLISLFVQQLHRSREQEHKLFDQSINTMLDKSSGEAVSVVETVDTFAMTIGFFQPTIYISRGLINQLTNDEYQAVIAHERAHQRAYDPLVTSLLSIFSTVFRFLPGARSWMSAAYSLRELAADAIATDGYRTTDALSSAFVKLSSTSLHPAISAFSPNRDRLEKLLDHHWTSPRRWWHWSAAVVVAVLVTGALSLGHFASAKSPAVPPAAAAACHETMVMCRIEHLPELPAAWLCANGRCENSAQLWSPLYAWTPVR